MRHLILGLCCLAAIHAADAPLVPAGTIPMPGVSGRIDHAAEDEAGHRLFLAALGSNTVEVIDLAQGRVVHAIDGLAGPQGVAYLPSLHRLVIAEGDGDAVDILEATTYARLGRIEHLGDADNVHADPANGLVYVGYGSGRNAALAVIDPQAMTVQRRIGVPGHPEGFALAASGPRIYVNVPDDRAIVVVDRASGATVARWPLADAQANFPAALDDAAGHLFVACRSPARLAVYAVADGSRIAMLPCIGDADDVFVDAVAHRVYITGGDGAITIVHATAPGRYEVEATVETASGARTSWFAAAAGRLYVACPHRLGHDAELRCFDRRAP